MKKDVYLQCHTAGHTSARYSYNNNIKMFTREQICQAFQMSENTTVEYKSAKGGFPQSFWETFSAFANTDGGIIVLGVKEKNGHFIADGFNDEDITKLKKTFWDNAHNKTQVSRTLLLNDDVMELSYDDVHKVLAFNIPRASYELRPIYLTQNPFGNTYCRSHEGDYKCSDDEIRQMFSDADHNNHPADGRILKGYSMDDIDIDTLHRYRQRFIIRHENHPWNDISDMQFLSKIGAYRKDRSEGNEGFTVAGLLMFGKVESIQDNECLPWYFVDYREKLSTDPSIRWTNRFIPDGTWECNLYKFFYRTLNEVSHALPVPFRLASDNVTRIDETSAHVGLREALANALIHAAWNREGNIVVERTPNKISIYNPGRMLISLEQFMEGGRSVCRNPYLQKMFSLIGVGEKAGSGAETIMKGWKDNNWSLPSVRETVRPDGVELTLDVSELVAIANNELNSTDSNGFPTDSDGFPTDLSAKSRQIMEFLSKSDGQSVSKISKAIQLSITQTKYYLSDLLKRGLIHSSGTTRDKIYYSTQNSD